MDTPLVSQHISLEPNDAHRLASLCGRLDEHIKQITQRLQVEIHNRGNQFYLSGESASVEAAKSILNELYDQTRDGTELTPEIVHLHLQQSNVADHAGNNIADNPEPSPSDDMLIRTKRVRIKPRGAHQREYVQQIHKHDINFGVGPAGTGKTWLAVACAVDALEKAEVQRILLVRPAVEAGEKLGFLPGDLAEKIDPYLRPLYDALYEMIGFEKVAKLMDRMVIEVAPLAYMRGRTLNNSFVILDEAQNTTPEQMKMFLTRIGFGTRAVITGDVTQVDLPRHQRSGLVNTLEVLEGVKGIGVTRFDSRDVVRHPLVQRIVEAYDRHERDTDTHR
ncbi:MAG: ATP-binding protein [Alcanivorax borkumensis]|uniref:PhoH-like protein n=1 Tax=Alcanivorax borkumensis (strain ATCC 700651 / DSM 11573 / NCIMB 13689 / SK2) TaxID=393595 RepID=Q0VN65_ALCBS|nr:MULTISPECIES: PhoH family protein [Alcanivorax]OJH07074.1 MAG: ATP-binding protein [Alcanivorax borkumensis]BAP14849.1 PhoH family protein [Alcanivorax sp. NBRC 101098]CAL17383.1 PhoH family protein [Alcanivorax borkumensis SK2]